jgi:hypothetical protein
MADNLEYFSSADGSEQSSPHESRPQHATPPAGRSEAVGSDFLVREGPQARAGGATTLSERLRRRQAYHADDTERRAPRPRDRAVTTSHKIAEAMTEFVGPDGRTYAAIPMDLYAEVAEEEAEQEVPEEEYDAEAAYVAWTVLSEEEHIARISAAQAALDTLPGNDRAIMERIVLVAANARAGLHEAAQRTRQYFGVGDEVIADGKAHGATFSTEHFESLLFAMDDQLANGPTITTEQLEECDAVVLGHTAVLTTGGTPIMPESFADSGAIYRTPAQSVGRFGVMTRDLDDEGNLRFGPFLWRNFRVAWRRYGPLVLLGLGWLWKPIYTRAEIVRELMAGTGAPTPVRRVAASRSIFFGLTAALTLLLLAGLLVLILNAPNLGKMVTDLAHGLTTSGGVTALDDCTNCPTLTPAAPTPTHDPTQPYPTATAPGSGGCGSACGNGQPTPTHIAGPTPTPVPTKPSDVFASSGTVIFTRASTSASSPSTLSASNGSTNNPAAGTQRGQTVSGSADGASGSFGNAWTKYANATYSTFKITYACLAGVNGCLTNAGTHIYDQSGNGHDCHLLVTAYADAGGFDYPTCQAYTTGTFSHINTVYYPYHPPSTGNAEMQSIVQDVIVGHGDLYAWYTPSGCTGQGSAAAQSAATNALNNALNGGLGTVAIGLQSSITATWCAYPGNCGQSIGSSQQMNSSTYIVCSTASGWKFTVSLGDSSGVQMQRISAPSGYAVDSSTINGCTPSIQSVNIAAVSATIACQATATARYVFDAGMKSAIASVCAGKLMSEVISYVNSYTGVKSGTVSLSYSPSNANRFPQSGGSVTINAN